MKIRNHAKCARAINLKGVSFKNLSIAALASAVFCTPAFAQDIVLGSSEANNLLSEKAINKPTLDYLKDKNISIPQKDAEPIASLGSIYTITEGTKTNHTFEYQIADKNGNIVTKYYNINLKNSDSSNFGTSKNVTWKEVNDKSEDNTIEVKLPGNVTKYFQYTYQIPEGGGVLTVKIKLILSLLKV